MTAKLFQPWTLRSVTVPNRVVLSPMCQYSARDGSATDWHLAHLCQYAMGGVGLTFLEATHVSAEGRISPHCLGLYSDENEKALSRVIAAFRAISDAPLAIQINHSGRKGSAQVPWQGGAPLGAGEGWTTLAPSSLPHGEGWPAPRELDQAGMQRIKQQFVDATRRAARLGIEVAEMHAAHGYLLHSFLSPISNRRADAYGGSLENRMRFPLEVFEAMRAVWPDDRPLGVRITGSDYMPGGIEVEEAIAFAHELKALGCDFVDVTGGGLSPDIKLVRSYGYQVPYAEAVRRATGLLTIAVGMIVRPRMAEAVIRDGKADAVALARTMLRNPRWVWDAADELGGEAFCPPQYLRGRDLPST